MHRALHHAQWLGGSVLCALLLWVAAGWASLHGPMQLDTLRILWGAAFLAIAVGGPLGWYATTASFPTWVARQERSCQVPHLWSTVIGVRPDNPFFSRLDAESVEAIQARRSHFRRVTLARWAALAASALALLATVRCGLPLLSELKIRMALGWVDDSIIVEAPGSVARGESWSLRVHTLQPGPWTARIKGIEFPLTNGALTLQSLRVATEYRIATAWGASPTRKVEVYEPVSWDRLQLAVTPPNYLELPESILDMRTAAVRNIVSGSRVSLRGSPAVEWSEPGHPPDWVAKTDETDRVRPVLAGRHGLWMNLPVRVVPDAPPEVRWVRPEQDVSWGEQRTKVEIAAADDWNVCLVELRIRRLGSEEGASLVLYRGRDRERTIPAEITRADLPAPVGPGLYSLTPAATDSAGQTTVGECRFLEVKPEKKADDDGGTPSNAEHTSLRGLIVALLDTLRDWSRDGREARLGRVRLELDAMAAVAETEAFKAAAVRWIDHLRDTAARQEVEGVVQEMVAIQEQGEKGRPPQSPRQEKAPSPEEAVSAAEIGKIETLQRAAMDANISPQLREALQKQLQAQFGAKSDALKKQLPGDSALIREIGMNQQKLTQSWSEDLAKTHLQQLSILMRDLEKSPKGGAGQPGQPQSQLLQSVKGRAESDQPVPGEELDRMHELSSQDGKIDWSSLASASEKWNRALQSGIPSLRERTKGNLLRELERSAPAPQQPASFPLEQDLAQALSGAVSSGDWDKAEHLARLGQSNPALIRLLEHAKEAPPGDQTALKQQMLAELSGAGSEASRAEGRKDLEKIMPIDPSWEPAVDKYFEMLNRRDPGP